MDLYRQLTQLVAALDEEGVEYALCGGLAMAVHSLPRATVDIDVMIEPSALDAVRRVAKGLGYDMDIGPMTFAGGRVRIHRLTMIDHEHGDVLPLDLLLVTPEVEAVWESRVKVQWEAGHLWVVSRAGLIELKRLRGSGQDQDDIRRLEEKP